MIAFLYPGQGSQHAGMGAPWRQEDSWDLVIEASDLTGRDVGYLLLEANDDELRQTRNAQLATFVTSMVALEAVKKVGLLPNGHAGHSLGEYSALCAAGVLSYRDALKLVSSRAEAMDIAARSKEGTMAAVIGLDDATVETTVKEIDDCWVANYNTPGQIVIAGSPKGVEYASEQCLANGAKKVVALSVSGAFHTPFMQPASQALTTALAAAEFHRPNADVYANYTAEATQSPLRWPELLANQLTGSVRWSQSMAHMLEAGFGAFVEIGPGGVLSTMMKRIDRTVSRFGVSCPKDLDAVIDSLCKRANEVEGGEHLDCAERLVVSPGIGVFNPDTQVETGSEIETGTPIGKVGDRDVVSAFCGEIVEYLAFPGERVQLAQPIAWLRSAV